MNNRTEKINGPGWQLIFDAEVSGPFVGTVAVATSDAVEFYIGASLPPASAVGFPAERFSEFGLSSFPAQKLYARSASWKGTVVLSRSTGSNYVPDA